MPIENHKKKLLRELVGGYLLILYFLKPFKSKAEYKDEEKKLELKLQNNKYFFTKL